MADKITAKHLLKTEGIITCNPRDSLSQALAKLSSSHDAVFVINGKRELLGVISPYHIMQKTNYQHNAKVENYLFSPPKIRESAPPDEIARNMLESKVYYLPVFAQNNKWLGIVSVRSLLGAFSADRELAKELKIPPRRTIFTIDEKATLKEARAIQNSKRISRLPVINHNGKLVGIITRYELQEAFSVPRNSQSFLSRVGEKRKFVNKPISNYFIRTVVTANEKTPLSQMISTMLEKEVGSIVLVNSKWQPVNILTTSDLLKDISKKGKAGKTNIIVTLPSGFKFGQEFTEKLSQLSKKLRQKNHDIHKIEATLNLVNNPAGEKKFYEMKSIVSLHSAKNIVAESTAFDWNTTLSKVFKKLKNQL